MNCQAKVKNNMLNKKSSLPRLPPEIWEEIFNYVTSPSDLLSAMNAGKSEWKEILDGRKSELFSLVLQLPTFMAYLPFSSILSCRLLNHSSKAIIDSTLFKCRYDYLTENKEKLLQPPLKNCLEKTIRKIENSYIFESSSDIESFLEKNGSNFNCNPNFNPFILGSFEIQLLNSGSSLNSAFLVNFFEIFGKFVLSLKIRFGKGYCAQVGILLSVLEQVGNLRELEIETMPSCYFFISWPFHFEEIYEGIEKCELKELRRLNVENCRTFIGMGEPEYWNDWGKWKDLPRTVEGAFLKKFEKQLIK